MKPSEKALADKMKDRLNTERERQHRWRVRQKANGLKSVAGMVSPEAFAVLREEKERTGERVSDILERALLSLRKAAIDIQSPARSGFVSAEPASSPIPVPEESESILNRIESMRVQEALPFNEIARRLNEQGIPAPEKGGPWDGRKVYELYKTIEAGR